MELANLTNLNSENGQKWDSQDREHRLEVKIQQIRQKIASWTGANG